MPLRMKATPYDDAVRRAQKRAARKSKHRPRPDRDESLTPPRNPPRPDAFEGLDEEPDVPPPQAHKRDDEQGFLDALADAEAADCGVGYHEDQFYARQVPAYATRYSSAAGAAAGIAPPGQGSYLNQMDEDEYAEFVRAGMWRRRNREEVERLERMDKERKAREEREKKEKDQRDREERERIRRLEERRKRQSKEDELEARRRYDEGWKKLQQAAAAPPPPPAAPAAYTAASSSAASTPAPPPPADGASTDATDITADAPPAAETPADKPPASFPLRFSDFPWPLFPPLAFPPLSWPTPEDLTPSAISAFLLPDSLPADKHKATIRQAVLAYHPDRFERYVLRVPEEKEETRVRVRELGLRVSQVLNDLAKKGP
ncbi:hypothetical protein JCM10450v2_006327 [Rhodotorula kratochvilovae]